MKKCIVTACALTVAMGAAAQSVNDTTAVIDSVYRSLPKAMVSGRRPVVKAELGKLVYNMNTLLKDRPADNAYDALKEILGVTEMDDQLQLGGGAVTVILDGKASTMTAEQLSALLKSMPKSRVAKCE